MYLLAYMLASKAKYFTNISDYDNFAYYLAYETFRRFTDKSKIKMKSVLNYMKSIMYWRRLAYNNDTFCEVINPDYNKSWNGDKYKNDQIRQLESQNRTDILQKSINEIFNGLPSIIKRNLPKTYNLNTVEGRNIYTSVLLSLLASYTLPKAAECRLQEKLDSNSSPAFNEMAFYRKNLSKEIILWHLPEGMSSVVQLVINKVNEELVNIIKDLSNDIKISDYDFELLSKSAYDSFEGNSDYGWY